jgi:hypothetical protein
VSRIRLELEHLTINRPKRRWNIYFVVATDHPEDENKYAVSVLPQPIIPVRRPAENMIDFVPEGDGTDGMEILERNMPDDRSIEVHCWTMHSRRAVREAGHILGEISKSLDTQMEQLPPRVLGVANPWVAIARGPIGGLGAIGTALRRVRDRNMGFVNVGEQFGPEFEDETELDRIGELSTGFGHLVWNWHVPE